VVGGWPVVVVVVGGWPVVVVVVGGWPVVVVVVPPVHRSSKDALASALLVKPEPKKMSVLGAGLLKWR
jgi:hypothetical protein